MLNEERQAKKLLNEWVKAWGSKKKLTYKKFFESKGRAKMLLEAFALFCVKKQEEAKSK